MSPTHNHPPQDALHRALLQGSPTPLLLLDANGRLIDLNPSAQAVFRAQLSRPNAFAISTWFSESEWTSALHRAREQNQWISARLTGQHDETPQEVELQAVAYGETSLYLMRATSLTAPPAAEARPAASAESDEFAYTVAHDLKEPLRGISNYAGFLLEDYEAHLDAAGQEMLHSLVRLARRSEQLITHLLRFSRLGQQDLQLQTLDLTPPITAIAEALNSRLSTEEASYKIQQPLPKAYGDLELVTEVFENLISNALKYNDKPDPWVRIGGDAGQGQIRFWVRDNGIGINPLYADKIFKIFKRLHPQDQYGGGSGCGLAIVKKIVERHGGSLWLESQEQVGSTFYFTLPAPLGHAEPASEASPSAAD